MQTRLLPLVGLALLALTAHLRAADKLPPDVEAIPSDSAFILTVRVAEIWDSEAGQLLRKQDPRTVEELSKQLKTAFGSDLGQITRLSIVAADFPQGEPNYLIHTRKAVDKAAVVKALLPEAKEEKRKDKVLYTQKDKRPFRRDTVQALHFIDDTSYIQGSKQDVEYWLDRSEDKPGLMQPARLAAARDYFVLAVNVEKFAMVFAERMPPEIEPFKALLAGKLGLLVGNVDKTTAKAELTLSFTGEKEAADGLKAAVELRKLSEKSLGEALKSLPKDFKGGAVEKLLTQFAVGLKDGKLEQTKTGIKGTMSVATDIETLTKAGARLIAEIRESEARAIGSNRMRQLVLGMHNYESTNSTLPPAAVYNKQGKALLSWRVLLLPHIGYDSLYKEFKLDEPWDSDHNKKLLAKMPDIYMTQGADAENKAHETMFQVFTGKNTVFQGARAASLVKISDGTSNTILIVEASKGVPWTKPEDLVYVADKPVPKLGFSRPDHFMVAYADGSVRFHKRTMKEENLRLRITPDDGQPVPNEDDD